MKKYFSFTGFACLCLVAFTTSLAAAEAVVVASPDGKVKLQLTAEDGVLRYDVAVDGQPVLEPSKLGIVSDGNNLGEGVTLGQIDRRKVNERYRLWGAHAEAVNRANEVTVTATSHGETFAVDIHVANDGAAARLRLAAKANRQIQGDSSAWRLPGNPALWATTLNPCYEDPYFTTTLDHLGTNAYGLPLTAKAGNVYVTLTEALLKDYGDLAVKRSASGDLQGFLFADPRGWTTDAAVVQPWRVTIVARDLTALVNSTLVADLNPPADPALLKASWIKPGRSAWQWMAIGAPHLDDQRQWVDWTKALGFEYYLVDEGWKSWPGNWAALASVCSYAKTNNVKVWLWVHSREVRDATARKAYFRRAVEAGVVGVKIDFPPACNRWWSNWYYDTAADAAACQLMVDFHGAVKPTGLERTWPNVLTREGIRGHEWHMTRYHRLMPAAHDTLLPFTRFIAGPGDYTPTVFEAQELQGNTWAHELAQMVVFTSPFLCTGGNPKDYLANPARDVLCAIPPVWDETLVLPGTDPGKVVATARRSGNNWFIGIINGADESTLDIPLNFLGRGQWHATRLGDVSGKADAWDRRDDTASKTEHLQLKLAPRGGFVAWFRK